MPSVLPICAALLARTRRLVIATDRLAASLHDPIRLAEDAIALDLLSGGRFVLGLSLCYRAEEFAGFNVDPTTDEANLENLVPLLRKAFSGQGVRAGARVAHVTPLPASLTGPWLMIAADGERGADRAAGMADMMMVDPTEPWSAVDAAVESYDHRRDDRLGELALFVYGGLSEAGREEAWNKVEDGFRYMRHNYDRWMGRNPSREIPPRHYRLILGTPDEVAVQALEYRRRYGDRVHLVLRCNYPGMADAAVRSQIELWARAAQMVRKRLT